MRIAQQLASAVRWVVDAHKDRAAQYRSIMDEIRSADRFDTHDLISAVDRNALIYFPSFEKAVSDLGLGEKYSLSRYDQRAHIAPVFMRLLNKMSHGDIDCYAHPYEKVEDGGYIRAGDVLDFLHDLDLKPVQRMDEAYYVVMTPEEESAPLSKIFPLVTPSTPYRVEYEPSDHMLDVQRIFILALGYNAHFERQNTHIEEAGIPLVRETQYERSLARQKRSRNVYRYRGTEYSR